VVAALGVTAGVMAKIATDVVLLAQSEVSEVSESSKPGGGASSAMPQKHNPIDAIQALAATRLAIGVVPVVLNAMGQEHERGAGGWHAESHAIPEIFRYTSSAVYHVSAALTGLDVHAQQMQDNLAANGGTLMAESLAVALAPSLGLTESRALARELSQRSRQDGTSLALVARRDTRVRDALSDDRLDHVFDPRQYLGATAEWIDHALDAWRRYQSGARQ
jgi:3-carboxy-cis,cis-muconate cycloisomerase